MFENKTLLSDSPLHTILGYNCDPEYCQNIIEENNLIVDHSRFKNYEYDIIGKNFEQFCKDYNINDDQTKILLLGVFRSTKRFSKEEKRKMKQFIKSSNFNLRLGKDLPNRLIRRLIETAIRRFSPLRKIKEINENEKEVMRNMYLNRRTNYISIASKFNCIPTQVINYLNDHFNEDYEPFNTGKWSSDEEKQLLDGLKAYFNTNDLSKHILDKKINFTKIQRKFKINRPVSYCRINWYRTLRWKVAYCDQFEDKFTRIDASKLIYCLFKLNYSNESDIDWDLIKDKFS